ncbi:LRR receptor-like serine/threonine-protein kinase EFR [Lycium barbarum]|uniref:LRR receptor-like serine/threonine-protein kinase EFR n=1 Tax=Lycium barbarum TaxID=112863 RepID=UPI00293E6881|nr:LRR receptor-like serine/threonine-protein kinase EFR [Lycium barbarum]
MKDIGDASYVIGIKIHRDRHQVIVFMAKNNKCDSRRKHIDIKYLAIREHVKAKKVVIQHVSTKLSQNNFHGDLKGLIFPNIQRLYLGGNGFTGKIPVLLSNAPNLVQLDLTANKFTGSIPLSFGKLMALLFLNVNSNQLISDDLNFLTPLTNCSRLQFLDIAYNQFTGELPCSIGNLSSQLSWLNFYNNYIHGSIHAEFPNLVGLNTLGMGLNYLTVDLSHNSINGTIQKHFIGLFIFSRTLNLSHNCLIGALPSDVGNMQLLDALDVSYNRLSDEIPNEIGQCFSLNKLYLQFNLFQRTIPNMGQLTGNVPLDGVFKNTSLVEIEGNNLCGGISQLDLHPCVVTNKGKPRKKDVSLKVTLAMVITFSFLLLALSTFTFIYKKKNSRTELPPTPSSEDIHFHPKIIYKELHNATRGFSSQNLIGIDNFGRVYEGALPPSEIAIAVKVLDLQQKGASKSLLAKCQALSNIHHRNLIKVLSICSSSDLQGNDFKALIYQFLPNGSLDKWLHPQERQRVYCPTPVVHCDLNHSNVLLDNDLKAHVSDFGIVRVLVKFNRETNVNQLSSLVIKGTIGYTAPGYILKYNYKYLLEAMHPPKQCMEGPGYLPVPLCSGTRK